KGHKLLVAAYATAANGVRVVRWAKDRRGATEGRVRGNNHEVGRPWRPLWSLRPCSSHWTCWTCRALRSCWTLGSGHSLRSLWAGGPLWPSQTRQSRRANLVPTDGCLVLAATRVRIDHPKHAVVAHAAVDYAGRAGDRGMGHHPDRDRY